MVIFFITFQPEICHIIADHLKDHSCWVFDGFDNAIGVMQNLINLPDLLVLDYTMHNHEIFDINEFMDLVKRRIPKIYYNDPCIVAGTRAVHWKVLIENAHGFKRDIDPAIYMDVFKRIEAVIADPDISQYIPLMQKPRPLPKNFYVTKMYKEASMKDAFNRLISFKIEAKVPENLFFLMELLYRSQDTPLSLEELQKQYEEDSRPIKISSLKCQISKLRRYIEDNPDFKYAIVKRKQGYLLLTI